MAQLIGGAGAQIGVRKVDLLAAGFGERNIALMFTTPMIWTQTGSGVWMRVRMRLPTAD